MENFSLYEILSFLVPGFIAVKIVDYINASILGNVMFFSNETNIKESIALLCIAMFIGIIIHFITFKLVNSNNKWLSYYKKIIYKSTQEISLNNESIQKVIPFLNEEYNKTKKHLENNNIENVAAPNLFDFAYYYLEINDKIGPAKSYQSMYFWFRNMFTIVLITIITTIFFFTFSFFDETLEDKKIELVWFLLKMILIGITIIPVANWLREKMIKKILWSYYVERVHKLDENNY